MSFEHDSFFEQNRVEVVIWWVHFNKQNMNTNGTYFLVIMDK